MVKRWVTLILLCLLARGWALAHSVIVPLHAQPAVVCEDSGTHGDMHAHHAHAAHHAPGDEAAVADDGPSTPDCRIVCDLGHAPALPGLWLPMSATPLPTARPLGWQRLQGVGPWPPELPPPARG
jgi:hypothetical protein